MEITTISIPNNKIPKLGEFWYVTGFPSINKQYEIVNVTRIGNRTFFEFDIDGIEYNAVIDLQHYQAYNIVILTNAD